MQIEVLDDGSGLVCVAQNGCRHTLSAERLWLECPSAKRRARRMQGLDRAAPRGLSIRTVEAVGIYGVNIAFSDGHALGIYPWTYLASLVRQPTLEDFLSN